METLSYLRDLAKQKGLGVIDRGNGHLQIVGGPLLVNYYPSSSKRSAYIAGTTARHKGVTPERAIEMALEPPDRPAGARKDMREKSSPKRRQQVAQMRKRFGDNCHWCGRVMEFEGDGPLRASIEHVIPLDRGGLDNANNRRLACQECNHKRGNQMPELKGVEVGKRG